MLNYLIREIRQTKKGQLYDLGWLDADDLIYVIRKLRIGRPKLDKNLSYDVSFYHSENGLELNINQRGWIICWK